MIFIPEKKYKEILGVLPIICVDVLLYSLKEKKFLFLKRTNEPEKNTFCCPGGRLQKGESLLDGAVREVKEEIGLNLYKKNLECIGVTDTQFKLSAFENETYHTINVTFLCNIDSDVNVKLNDEGSEWKWMKGNEEHVSEYVRNAVVQITEKELVKKSNTLYTTN